MPRKLASPFFAAASVAIAIACEGRANGQDTTGAFRSWCERLKGTVNDTVLDGVAISWRSELLYVPPPAELAAMRSRVAGHPDHPERRLLAAYEARSRGSPDLVDHQMWRYQGRWRFNTTYPTPGGDLRYDDAASDGTTGWYMGPSGITFFDPRSASEPILHLGENGVFEQMALLNLELWLALQAGVKFAPALVGPGSWRASGTAVREPDKATVAVEAEGSWNESEGWGSIDRLSYRETKGERVEGFTDEGKDWRLIPSLRLGVATTVTRTALDGILEKRWTLTDTATFTSDEFAGLVKPPEPDATDPVRGPVTYTAIFDHRPNHPVASTVKDGKITPSAQAPRSPATPGEHLVRTAGWVSFAAIGTALVFLRVRRIGKRA